MNRDWVAILEARFSPLINDLARQLKAEFPDLRIIPSSASVGGATTNPGHGVALSVLLPNKRAHEPDLVDLDITIRALNTTPMLDSADIVWGHPSAHVEFELLEKPRPLTDESLDFVAAGFDRLVAALRAAIERGAPPAEK